MIEKETKVYDEDGAECVVKNSTKNSVEVEIKAKTKEGIDCRNWFTDKDFQKRFKLSK